MLKDLHNPSLGKNRRGQSNKDKVHQQTQDPKKVNHSSKKYLCGKCENDVVDNPPLEGDQSINCNRCKQWFHHKCTELTPEEFQILFRDNEAIVWYCEVCLTKIKNKYEVYLKEYKDRSFEYEKMVFGKFNQKIKIERMKKRI